MNILMGNFSFKYLSGSEIYYYELGRELVKRGHTVVMTADSAGSLITQKAKECGIKVYHVFKEPENFIPDIIHASHLNVIKPLLKRYPKTPMVSTIHSEYYSIENPIKAPTMKKYICIRESIKQKIIRMDGIQENMAVHIPNGFDLERFNKNDIPKSDDKMKVLYIGMFNYLRRNSVLHLLNLCQKEGWVPQFIGLGFDNYLDGKDVEWIKPDQEIGGFWNIEKYIKACGITAGILLGRTTIEGWLCGKPGLIYDIDVFGGVKSFAIHMPPKDVEKTYDIKNICTRIEAEYKSAMESA